MATKINVGDFKKLSAEEQLKNLSKRHGKSHKIQKIHRFEKEEFLVHSENEYTKKAVTNYLNDKLYSEETVNTIDYTGKEYTCYNIVSLEMLNWLRKNSGDFKNQIFHREKTSLGKTKPIWKRLSKNTIIK